MPSPRQALKVQGSVLGNQRTKTPLRLQKKVAPATSRSPWVCARKGCRPGGGYWPDGPARRPRPRWRLAPGAAPRALEAFAENTGDRGALHRCRFFVAQRSERRGNAGVESERRESGFAYVALAVPCGDIALVRLFHMSSLLLRSEIYPIPTPRCGFGG